MTSLHDEHTRSVLKKDWASDSTSCLTVTSTLFDFCDDTDLVTNLVTNKKALVSEGLVAKQVLDLVGCAGKI